MVGVPAAGDTLERVDPETYNRLREELLAETLHVVYSDSLVAYQEGLSRMANGALFRLRVAGSEGLACTEYLDDDTVMVKELLIPRPGMAGAAALIGAEMPAVRYHLRTPPFWDGVSGSYLQAFAMVNGTTPPWNGNGGNTAGAIWAWGSTKEAEKENTRP